mmetsp:Transcript_54742/g.62927  ORF Transcript_54742/g.62927 Transcript_54742/m.62927 type:complete len:657 (-) Transcript_54742:48-2018(-)|eukprot:CAMPEP_0176475908 /NCGR_PEP_ID=MMETSP0127-20121128/43860_1 /TAXON_ID=938130 /ORGANISM="Platyophrya macrostoma, Strain WH" /LENGTH=656 /DNA_ID=CAMNT_0017871541 /DNA_START=53 /DNA_END=2023 /DNA_ORIENTATION=+
MATFVNSPPGRQSFFDDDNLDIKFDWGKLEKVAHFELIKHQPLQKETWTRTTGGTSSTVQAYFHLYERHLVQYKNNTAKQPELIIEIANSKMKVLPADNETYGFSLTKNGITYEFTTKDESVSKKWCNELKSICVLSTFHDDYKAIKMIGKGSFAKVYLVESKTTLKQFAVKAFTKESVILSNKANAKPSMINEIDIMRHTNHENIIRLYEVYETEKSIYLVLELVQGKSMQEVLKKPNFKELYSEIKCINLIRSLLDALGYLASRNIMHRDLKPDNILLDKGEKIKIVDFGLATFIKIDEYIFKKCGTPGYIAPEVFKYDHKNPSTNYDDRCDVFSAGCILFFMLFGVPFFDGGNASEILKMNRKFTTEFDGFNMIANELKKPDSKISKAGLSLVQELLEFDQKQRPRAWEALKHPYFTPIPGEMIKTTSMSDGIESPSKNYSDPNTPKLKVDTSKPSNTTKERYEQKDSLYIDVGQPMLNGRTDTMNSGLGSNNNSLLLGSQGNSNSNSNSGANSPSKFGGGGRERRETTGIRSGGNNLLKAAIVKNAQYNNANFEDESPKRMNRESYGFSQKSNEVQNEEDEESTNDYSRSQSMSEKGRPTPLMMPSKRFTIIAGQGATGNSPTLSPQKGNKSPTKGSPTLKVSKVEETKSSK